MTRYGTIVALLNSIQLIIRIEDENARAIQPGSIVTAFASVKDPQLEAIGIEEIYSPKGNIRIVLQQKENIFLAERFKEGDRIERVPYAALDLFTKEVRVGGHWSADIATEDTLGIEFPEDLKVGDVVGEI